MPHPPTATVPPPKWILFDLDDTLHPFRLASSAATTQTLRLLLTQHPHLPQSLDDLQSAYSAILTTSTAAAFTDGKPSHFYRAQRFRALLHSIGVPDAEVSDAQMNALLECYEASLMGAVKLHDGVMELFSLLKSRGVKIGIVTEGPQDAQERTVEKLGIRGVVDRLVTTNKTGVSKVDGLVARVVEELRVGREEVLVVGDSWERDVVPALEKGVGCVWVDWEGSEEGWKEREREGVVRVGGIAELLGLMR